MTKTYFNDAVIGNSNALACLTGKGELVRLFWPHIDMPQHIEKFYCGVYMDGVEYSTRWFQFDPWACEQCYIKDANILKTEYISHEMGIKATQTDYVLPEDDIMVRSYIFENIGNSPTVPNFILHSHFISTTTELGSTLFHFDRDALVHYKYNYYFAIAGDRKVFQFQLGNNSLEGAASTRLNGYDEIGMMADGAVSWKLGELNPGESTGFNLFLCPGKTLKEALERVRKIRARAPEDSYLETVKFWKDYLENLHQISTRDEKIQALYRRSLLVFKLMSDGSTGGLLAAPEVDENFTRCGRYAYCWGRDAAFITSAMDHVGLHREVDKFYEWAAGTQEENGSWLQRYHMDGNLAPSWGLQIDETGTILMGIVAHYEETGDMDFLRKMWDTLRRGAEFLVSFLDPATGLPKPSYDLWEERIGEHTYSASAVYAGLLAAVKAADLLETGEICRGKWHHAALELKKAIKLVLWDNERKCFHRSILVKMNPWGGENIPDAVMITVNPKGYKRDFTPVDRMVDVSLLGVAIPFAVLDPSDVRVESTVKAIEDRLTNYGVGGIKRYESDQYIGGNPWVLTTLWVALYHIRTGRYEKAAEYFRWAVKSRTKLDLLPEQVSRETGEPAWVIPLTWSHAMFILVLLELLQAGQEL